MTQRRKASQIKLNGFKSVLTLTTSYLLAACAVMPSERVTPSGEMEVQSALPEFCGEIPRPGWAAIERVAVNDPWFHVHRLSGDLYAISEPYQWQEVINYLFIGRDSALLFDTGNGISDIKAVVDYLTDKPVIVVASHSHYDHVGGHWQFDHVLAPDTAFTRARQRGHENTAVREEVSAAALCRSLPKGVTLDNHHIRPFDPAKRIEDGAVIDLGGLELEVLSIPGHTPDSIALFDGKNGRLFTGDTYYKGPIWLFAPETDLESYGNSLARLALLAPELTSVHGAHNEPFSHPNELIKVQTAFGAILNGDVEPAQVSDGQALYEFETFDFLMQADHSKRP